MIKKWLRNRYYWIRGFIYGLVYYEEIDSFEADLLTCEDCVIPGGHICENHQEEITDKVYGKTIQEYYEYET